jgi:hypothetical protein
VKTIPRLVLNPPPEPTSLIQAKSALTDARANHTAQDSDADSS